MKGIALPTTHAGVYTYKTWCVEIDEGKKVHVTHTHDSSPGLEDPDRVSVDPCDGSCGRVEELPSLVWEKAQKILWQIS